MRDAGSILGIEHARSSVRQLLARKSRRELVSFGLRRWEKKGGFCEVEFFFYLASAVRSHRSIYRAIFGLTGLFKPTNSTWKFQSTVKVRWASMWPCETVGWKMILNFNSSFPYFKTSLILANKFYKLFQQCFYVWRPLVKKQTSRWQTFKNRDGTSFQAYNTLS